MSSLIYPPFDDPEFTRLYPFRGTMGQANTFLRPDLTGRVHLKMNYLDEGAGDPVVMLHGNPTWSFYYRNLVLALRDKYRCVVPDHIGMGLSDKPPATQYDYSLKSRIDDLEALLDSLNITSNITLVMQDWGGMIGMGYAARHPERIKRIVATNTGCTRLPRSKPFPWSLWLGRNTALGAWLILKRNYFCRKAADWCVTRNPLPPDVRAMYLMPYDTPEHRVAVLKFVQTIPLSEKDPGYDIVKGVEEASPKFAAVPTLLLWGMKDFVFDRHFLAEWQRHFPHAQTHTWPDCGHYLLEDAGEEAIPKIQQFLAAYP
jgi:cis-3-alkyl-4-acyloxetan-2-one decarboxylase